MAGDPDSAEEDKKGENENKISKKKLKKQSRLTVAELKQIVERPDLVEMHDVTSMDPKLLVLLKSTRNSGKVIYFQHLGSLQCSIDCLRLYDV